MSKTMLVNVTHVEESRVAILEDGVLEQYEIETINRTNIKGNIHNAIVENVHPALEAAFLRISSDMKGFLPLDEVNFKLLPARTDSRKAGKIGQHLHPGQKIMVQVVREPFAGKPPTVTTYFSLPGRYLVLMPGVDAGGISRKIEDSAQREKLKAQIAELNPPEGFGLIVRTAGVGQSKQELQRDLRYLLRLWESIQRASRTTEFPGRVYRERDLVIRTMRDYFTPDIDEVWIDNPETYERALAFVSDVMPSKAKIIKLYTGDRPLFSKWNLEEQIENVYKRRVSLRSGGEIVIDGTEALTAIDVNSKGAPRGGDAEENATSTNLEAAAEISRQLRLRDLGGLVVIDFIDMMAARNQKKVEKAMRDAMKGDRAKYDVTRISKLGLMEIARQRIRGEKMGASYTTCPMCEGYGLVKNIEPAGLAALRKLQMRCQKPDFGRVRMGVPPEIAHWVLNHKRDELVALERRHNIRIHIEPKSTFLRHESEFEFFPREKVEVPPALVILDRPAPPAPPDLKELEAAQGTEVVDKAEPAAAAAAPDRIAAPAPSDSADEKGENGRRRRRRRRRRGRGGSETESESASESTVASPDVEAATDDLLDDAARVANAMPSVIEGEPAEVEPVDADEDPSDDGESDAVDEPAGASASAGMDGDNGGHRKRRRRRRRRGRGGAGAERTEGAAVPVAAPAPTASHAPHEHRATFDAPPMRAADPDEIVVPRHIQGEELLPAATGGRRRKHQGDGPQWRGRPRRRPRGGGENSGSGPGLIEG